MHWNFQWFIEINKNLKKNLKFWKNSNENEMIFWINLRNAGEFLRKLLRNF